MLKKIFRYFIIFFFIILIIIVLIEILGPAFKGFFSYNHLPQKIIINHFEKSNLTEFTLKKDFSGRHLASEAKFDTIVTTDTNNQRITKNNNNNKEKVYIFGDSFVFGHGVNDNETMPFYLQKENLNFSFQNLGFTAGRDLTSYYVWLKEYVGIKNIFNGIIVFYKNDIEDMRRNKCFNSINKEVDLLNDDCVNIESNFEILNGKLYEKKSFLLEKLYPFYTLLKRSYSVALVRVYYDYIIKYFNKPDMVDSKKENRIQLNQKERDNIKYILRYFKNNINLMGLVLIDYDSNNLFYDYIIDVSNEMDVKIIKIDSLDIKYRIGINDPHYNKAGNQKVAKIINDELF
mgnify:FL=1